MKMKMCHVAFASLCLLLAGSARAAIIVSEADPSGSGSSSYGADWFELTNTGAAAVNITGWSMDDNSNAFATSVPLAGVTSIAPGKSAVFLEGDGTNAAAFKTAWFGASVPVGFTIGSYMGSGVGLSTAGDAVNIFSPVGGGTLITGVSFGAAPSSPVRTFDNAAGLTGSISTPSAVGVNGAFNSGGALPEIGSPGTTGVPEPATFVLAGMGLCGLVAGGLRRRK
jgi:hypothetical protein